MKMNMSMVRFTALAVAVMALGALAGWYLFVSRQVDANDARNQARGFGNTVSFGGSIGSALGNLFGGDDGQSGISTLIGSVIDGIRGTDGESAESNQAPRVWKITQTPVAGFGFTSSSSKLYFAERSSGNILTADPAETKIERLTNTLFAKTYEALFASDGSVILRSISDNGQIVSYAAVMATNTSPAAGDTLKKLEGVYLPQNIISIDARPSSKELFFILKEGDGSAGITSNWLGGSQGRVFSSALSDWNAFVLADGARFVAQKPSDDVLGYAFKVLPSQNTSSVGGLEKIAAQPGLSVLPRTRSTAVLYSSVSGGIISLYARTATDGTEIRLPVRTIAEKCVWSPDTRLIAYCAVPQTTPARGFLRNLFDGSTHTSDAWYRVDVAANSAEQIFVPDSTISFDVEAPAIDVSGAHIGFMDREDKSLWLLRIQP